MLILKIEFVDNPNSCQLKISNQKFHALLHSGAGASLIHTRVYNNIKNPP